MDPPLPRRTLQGPGRCRAFVGHDLACGVFGMSLPGYVVPIPPGRCMYALHLIGPELPTRMGMLSISVLVVHYA